MQNPNDFEEPLSNNDNILENKQPAVSENLSEDAPVESIDSASFPPIQEAEAENVIPLKKRESRKNTKSTKSNVSQSDSTNPQSVANGDVDTTGEAENTNEETDSEKPETALGRYTEAMRILEALLFASEESLTNAKLKTLLPGEPDARAIRKIVDDINMRLQKERHPFEIVEVAGGYQFRTISYYSSYVRQLLKEKAVKKLSIQALECLAIIAYKQPITKAEIEAIRGVVSDGAMKTLLERRTVTIAGRSEKAGRPLLYATTKEFLTYFGLKKLADLPRIDEMEALAKEKFGDLETELAQMKAETEEANGAEAVASQATDADGEIVQETLESDTQATQAEDLESLQPENPDVTEGQEEKENI